MLRKENGVSLITPFSKIYSLILSMIRRLRLLGLLIISENILRNINGAVFGLLEGSANIFADNANAQKLYTAKKQDQHNDRGITGNCNAEEKLLDYHK